MNNKGFSLVELVVSLTLLSIIIILLFELIMSIRDVYLTSGIKTELLTKQALISEKINDDFNNNTIANITNCGENCLNITFENNTVKMLTIDNINNVFKYGDYATNLIHNSEFKKPLIIFNTFYNVNEGQYDSFINIKIPISHRLYPENDFGVDATYQYDSRQNYLDIVSF